MLEESRLIWNEFTGGVRQPESPYPFYTGTNNTNSLHNSKTTAIGNNKAKAIDLNLTGSLHSKLTG